MGRLISTLAWLAVGIGSAAAQETRLELNPRETHVDFTLPTALHTVHGSFALKRGVIHFDSSTGQAGGEIVVDATSGNSGSDGRDKRMHKEIIESNKYTDISFVPDHVEGKVDLSATSEVRLHGIFKIHGAEHELVLTVTTEASQGQIIATTSFSVPYVEWGMKNASKLILKVDPIVEIHIRAVANRR
jgi:polyisoprenoid-binding protein YceI